MDRRRASLAISSLPFRLCFIVVILHVRLLRGLNTGSQCPNTNTRRQELEQANDLLRRRILWSLPLAFGLSNQGPQPSHAALIQFPQTKSFANTYHLLRVGTTMLEEDDIWSTNPLFLTNREDALSVLGQEQIVRACQTLKLKRFSPTVVRHSLAAAAVDTANLIARELNLGRDRLGAEFTFLDPRAIGKWDMLSKSQVLPAVWALDDQEAGPDGTGGRPPPNEDGTPHETLADQVIRLRQLLSLLETQYSGDTVLLIFPDGTGPAVLSAMIAGIPLNKAHLLEFSPGELRLNVTHESVQETLAAKVASQDAADAYARTIAEGQTKLEELRSTDTFVNRKDERLEQERLAIEEQYNQEQELKRQMAQQKLEKEQRERALMEKQKSELRQDGSNLQILGAATASFAAVLGATQLGKKEEEVEEGGVANAIARIDLDNSTKVSSASDRIVNVVASTRAPETMGIPRPQLVNGDIRGTFTQAQAPLDQYAVAQQAMEDYMNQDDGGDAWLLSLSEIMSEAEQEEEIGDTRTPPTPPEQQYFE